MQVARPYLYAVFAGTSVAMLAACSGDGVTTVRSADVGSAAFYVQSAAANGTNAVVVRNSPYPPEAVLDALRDRYKGNQYRFALGAPPDWNGYTVVIGFGQPPVGAQNQCENPNLPQALSPPGIIELVADYCSGNRLITETRGRAPATGPDDSQFRELIGQTVGELFTNEPERYPGHGGGTSPR